MVLKEGKYKIFFLDSFLIYFMFFGALDHHSQWSTIFAFSFGQWVKNILKKKGDEYLER